MRHSSVLGPALEQLPAEAPNLIISDEGLWHFTDSQRSDTARLARLLEGYDVTVLIYLRRPDSFLNSWFQQGLKSGTGARTMTGFLASSFTHSGLQFLPLIQRYESLFGPESIKLRAYEKSQLAGGDAVIDFLHTTGLPADEFTLPTRANTTPDTDSLLLRSVPQENRPENVKFETLNKDLVDQGKRKRHYNLLTAAETKKIVTTYRPQFIQLQEKYGGGTSPGFFRHWPDPAQVDDAMLSLRWTQEAMLGMITKKRTRRRRYMRALFILIGFHIAVMVLYRFLDVVIIAEGAVFQHGPRLA